MNSSFAVGAPVAVVAAIGAHAPFNRSVSAGPDGDNLVPLDGGATYAEAPANQDHGELMTHVRETDLRAPQSLSTEPIAVGGDQSGVRLMLHSMSIVLASTRAASLSKRTGCVTEVFATAGYTLATTRSIATSWNVSSTAAPSVTPPCAAVELTQSSESAGTSIASIAAAQSRRSGE